MTFLITADVHGSINTWLTLKNLMGPKDTMVIAGDLFDTRYGRFGHPDFDPETIRQDLAATPRTFYYIYGNCDIPSFFPGYDHTLRFAAANKKIFLHHGHRPGPIPSDAQIIIQGHTHIWALEKQDNRIFMNPGSITRPKKGGPTYGIIDDGTVCIMDLKNGTPLAAINI